MPTRKIPNELRDEAITAFRHRICEQFEVVPLVHQAQWFAAADGQVLLDIEVDDGIPVRLADGTIQRRAIVPRPHGRARVIGDLGSFKIGKSFAGGLFAASFACVPGGRVSLVGSEYDICEPEFDYICDFLLSERGLSMRYSSLQNRPRDGKMWLDLLNGMRFEAKSWERKDALKGKELGCYTYCEAYQLPGLGC